MQFASSAQSVSLVTDRNIYAAGEKIWFSTQLSIETESAVLYADLTNEQGEHFINGKFAIADLACNGVLQLPSDLRTGTYYLRTYTKEQLSSTHFQLSQVELIVVNYQSAPLTKMKTSAAKSSTKLEPIELDTRIERGIVNLNIDGLEAGEYCLTVVPRNTFNPVKQNISVDCSFPEARTFGFTEKRSTTLKGSLLDPSNKTPIANTLIVGSTMGSSPELHLGRTDENGRFILVFRAIMPAEVVYLLAPEIIESETKFLVDQEFPSLNIDHAGKDIVMTDSLVSILNRVSFNAKMNSVYGEEAYSTLSQKGVPPPFTNPTEEIVLADFIALGSMKEVFTELIPYSAVREKDGEQFISIYDHQFHKPLENPLVLLDNVPFINHNEILRLAPSKIKAIRVIANPYYYGDEKINGVVSIHSKNGRLGGLDLPKSVELIDFSGYEEVVEWKALENELPGKAALSNTLYWNPRITVGNNGLHLNFESGQQQGDFDVFVIEHSAESQTIMQARLRINP